MLVENKIIWGNQMYKIKKEFAVSPEFSDDDLFLIIYIVIFNRKRVCFE